MAPYQSDVSSLIASVRCMDELMLPSRVAQEIDLERSIGETRCPAASDGTYTDSRRRYIHCRVAGEHFAVADNTFSAASFCCGEYTGCPVWLADQDGGEKVAEVRESIRERATERETRRQISQGLRVDDRGVGPR